MLITTLYTEDSTLMTLIQKEYREDYNDPPISGQSNQHIIKYETEDKEILQVTENVKSKNNKQERLYDQFKCS